MIKRRYLNKKKQKGGAIIYNAINIIKENLIDKLKTFNEDEISKITSDLIIYIDENSYLKDDMIKYIEEFEKKDLPKLAKKINGDPISVRVKKEVEKIEKKKKDISKLLFLLLPFILNLKEEYEKKITNDLLENDIINIEGKEYSIDTIKDLIINFIENERLNLQKINEEQEQTGGNKKIKRRGGLKGKNENFFIKYKLFFEKLQYVINNKDIKVFLPNLKTLYKIYKKFVIDKEITDFIKNTKEDKIKYKKDVSLSVVKKITEFKTEIEKFNIKKQTLITDFKNYYKKQQQKYKNNYFIIQELILNKNGFITNKFNRVIELEKKQEEEQELEEQEQEELNKLKEELNFENFKDTFDGIPQMDIVYKLEDFINHLEEIYQELLTLLNTLMQTFTKEIDYYNEKVRSESKDIEEKKEVKPLSMADIREEFEVRKIYEEARLFVDKNKEDLENKSEKEKGRILVGLGRYKPLLDTNTGSWKEHLDKDETYRETLQQLHDDYFKMMQELDISKIDVKEGFDELDKIFKQLKEIKQKAITKGENATYTEDELDLIENFETKLENVRVIYKEEPDYKNEEKKVINLFKELNKNSTSLLNKQKLDKIKEEKRVLRNDTIYFSANISIFKIALKYIILFSILLLISILLLSICSIIILIYDTINYIISLFVNPNLTKALSIDYISKNIIRCTKNNYSDDRYLILTGQKQNILLFNLSAYTIYLIIIFFLFYVAHVFYANSFEKFLEGNLQDLDKEGTLLTIFFILLMFGIFNLAVYLLLFKPYVYLPYKRIDTQEKTIDKKIANYILIRTNAT